MRDEFKETTTSSIIKSKGSSFQLASRIHHYNSVLLCKYTYIHEPSMYSKYDYVARSHGLVPYKVKFKNLSLLYLMYYIVCRSF